MVSRVESLKGIRDHCSPAWRRVTFRQHKSRPATDGTKVQEGYSVWRVAQQGLMPPRVVWCRVRASVARVRTPKAKYNGPTYNGH